MKKLIASMVLPLALAACGPGETGPIIRESDRTIECSNCNCNYCNNYHKEKHE